MTPRLHSTLHTSCVPLTGCSGICYPGSDTSLRRVTGSTVPFTGTLHRALCTLHSCPMLWHMLSMLPWSICQSILCSMAITSIVSHGPGALKTGPVCYNGAQVDTVGKARMYSEHPWVLLLSPTSPLARPSPNPGKYP
jgi:hypothetical protein